MGLFRKAPEGDSAAEPDERAESAADGAPAPRATVFEPQAIEEWDSGELPTGALPLLEPPDFYGPSGKAAKTGGGKKSAKAGKGAKSAKGAKKVPGYQAKAPDPGLSDAERRAALRVQMEDLTQAYKDRPAEEMEAAIRETLIAHGQEVPDDWVATIAEGLRTKGPTKLNLDGPQ